MPCRDDGADEHYNQQEYGLRVSSQDIATMVACEAMKRLAPLKRFDNRIGKAVPIIDEMSELARKWWEKHKQQDADKRWGR